MKTFRDPVHNIIQFDKDSERLLLDLIDTRDFQRLRYIKQLGMSSFTYPGAEHSRFTHSLGVAHLMKRIIHKICSLKGESEHRFSKELDDNRMLALVAALLHDIGHGPFSHALEKTTKINHEDWTSAIILGKTEINILLENHKKGFAKEVVEVIQRTHHSNEVVKLLSSQLDADRIDYLLRDSMMTGAGYGLFDVEWLINVLKIGMVNGDIEVGLDERKGLSIAEDFVMARYYMYKNVYFHKATRSAEMIVDGILQRAVELHNEGKAIELPVDMLVILTKGIDPETIENYLNLTENTIWHYFMMWKDHPDPILSDFCNRLLHRNLYKSISPDRLGIDFYKKILEVADEDGIPHRYLFFEDSPSTSTYKDTYLVQPPKPEEEETEREASEQIFLFDDSGKSSELADKSLIINIIRNKPITEQRFFVPKEYKKRILEG